MKNIIFLLISLFILSSQVLAQEIEIISKKLVPIKKDIVDFTIKEDKYLLLTNENEIYELDKDNQINKYSDDARSFSELMYFGDTILIIDRVVIYLYI